jgi:tRNA threonylcarbamoyladenosine biosynthesis protein TsaE
MPQGAQLPQEDRRSGGDAPSRPGGASSVESFLFLAASPEETARLARACAARSFPGLAILLEGDLGAGKTQFVRFFAEYFGRRGVRSPSFTLVNEYKGDPLLVHADLYRISLGDPVLRDLEEALRAGAVLLVEWADRWTDSAGEEQWRLVFAFDEGEEGSGEGGESFLTRRRIHCTALGERARRSLGAVKEDMGLSGTNTGTNAGADRPETSAPGAPLLGTNAGRRTGTNGPERGGSLSGANRSDTNVAGTDRSDTNVPGAPLFGTNAGRRTGTNDPGRTEPGKGGETP